MFRRQSIKLADHPLQAQIAELEGIISLGDGLVTLGLPASTDITVIAWEEDFFDIVLLVLRTSLPLILLEQSWLEFATTFVYRYSVSNRR